MSFLLNIRLSYVHLDLRSLASPRHFLWSDPAWGSYFYLPEEAISTYLMGFVWTVCSAYSWDDFHFHFSLIYEFIYTFYSQLRDFWVISYEVISTFISHLWGHFHFCMRLLIHFTLSYEVTSTFASQHWGYFQSRLSPLGTLLHCTLRYIVTSTLDSQLWGHLQISLSAVKIFRLLTYSYVTLRSDVSSISFVNYEVTSTFHSKLWGHLHWFISTFIFDSQLWGYFHIIARISVHFWFDFQQ